MVCKSVSFTEEKKWFYNGGASMRYHLVTKVFGFFKHKSDGFIGEGCENGHMLIYLSKTMREITSDSKSVNFTK